MTIYNIYIYHPKYIINILYIFFYNGLTQLCNHFVYCFLGVWETSHTNLHSVIDVECINSVSNRSKDIISLIIKVCRWVLLNNKIFAFHDLFTFTESIDKQQPLFQLITINYYMCVGERAIVNCYSGTSI